jgi:uncharacterized protein (DUF2336 family)
MAAPLEAFLREIDSTLAHSSRARRASMLRHLTDFFVVGSSQYSDEEIALIDDVFVRLISAIEESSRALLAIRLGPLSKAPPKVLRMLANDDAIEIASPILVQSEQLDDPTLVECAKTKSQEHLLAISRRKILREVVTDVLVERGDQQVVFSTARNSGAKFSNVGFNRLVDRSVGDDRLAMCVGRRSDIPPRLFQRLLKEASEIVRSKLETEIPTAKRRIDRAVADITSQIEAQAALRKPEDATAQVLVNALHQAGRLDAERLEAFAKAGQFEEIIIALSIMSDTPSAFVESAIKNAHSETLIIISKAIGLPWHTTRRIHKLCAERCHHLTAEIDGNFGAFQRLKQSAAQQILSFHREQESSGSKQKPATTGEVLEHGPLH